MDESLIFAVFLYFACAALLFAEVFVPSGGLLSVLAMACVGGGIALFFQHSAAVGWTGVVVAGALIPSVLVVAYKIFPKTKFGKEVTLKPSDRSLGDAIPDAESLKSLMGQQGVAKSPMRPVGVCDFSGRRVECVAENGYVEPGTSVRVIRVQGTQLTVRVVEG